MTAASVRTRGTVTRWNDERGYGFVTPTPDAPDVFVHISALSGDSARPQIGDSVSFSIGTGPDGRPVAQDVVSDRRIVPVARPARPRRPAGPQPRSGRLGFLAIGGFGGIYLLVNFLAPLPPWVTVSYLGTSVLAFVLYASDKSAAKAGQWRVPESTLLTVGLIGGWPGA